MSSIEARELSAGKPAAGRRQLTRLVGYLVSATCLVVLAWRVDWGVFAHDFLQARPALLVLAVPFIVATYASFTLRWRVLLGSERAPSLFRVGCILMTGYFANAVLPLRAGDALRVALLRNRYGHPVARVVGSIVLERLLDVITLLAFGAVLAAFASLPEKIVGPLRGTAVVAFIGILIILMIVVRASWIAAVLERSLTRINTRLAASSARHLHHFVDVIRLVTRGDRQSNTRLAGAILLSAIGWGTFAIAMMLCTAAFQVHPAFTGGLLLTVMTNLGSAIPASPGSLGVYHALAVLALSVWDTGFDVALAVATVSHAIATGVQLLLGSLAMLMTDRSALSRPTGDNTYET